MRKALNWLDDNIITLIAGFLLIFIPLYPKIPAADILPGYIVRIRLEDFFILASILIFGIQFLRKKVKIGWDLPSIGIIVYIVIGLISVFWSIFVAQTVPMEFVHIGKTALHWLRRIEYFSLFFIFFGTGRDVKKVKIIMTIFFLTVAAVTIYGYGQKYLAWCAFSTMNREFSKGACLYLTEHSRVLSTFGGHYDLAAYLVIALSLAWSFFFGLKNKFAKIAMGVVILCGLWLLILTASRISFGAYLVGLAVVVFIWSFKKGVGWGISRGFVALFLSILLMLSFGDLSDRFLTLVRFDERFGGIRQILLASSIKPPAGAILVGDVTSRSDQPPTPIKPGDVTGDEAPLFVNVKQADGSIKRVEKPRTYSKCALRFDLSTCIRLESTWPRAFGAFEKSPLFGTGYATLTKAQIEDFTEAESTDNDYLRSLGETGALGFLAFFGVVVGMAIIAFRSLSGIKDPFVFSLVAGFIAFVVGILANAAYIDVFESSKVAYVFWGLSGLTLGTIYALRSKIAEDREPFRLNFDWKRYLAALKKFFLSDVPWVLLLVVLVIVTHAYNPATSKFTFDGPIADWHSWRQADTSSVSRRFDRDGINLLYPTFDDVSSIPSGLPNPNGFRYVEFPIYNAATVMVKKFMPELSIEAAGRTTSALATAFSALFLFLIARRIFGRRAGYLVMITYALIPYNLFYGRSILPDPTMVTFSLGSIYFALRYATKSKIYNLVLSLIFGAIALLVKPYAFFLLAPIAYILIAAFGFSKKFLIVSACYALAVIPLLWWRQFITAYPAGIPANDWLFNGDGIRFKGAFWQWIFADRIGRLILGFWGLILLAFGIVRKPQEKFGWFPLIFLLTSLCYVFVFATGNVRHDYYQILLVPSLALLVGLGVDSLLKGNFVSKGLAVIAFIFMVAFGWYQVRDYYNVNHPEIVKAGRAFDKLVDNPKVTVIAPYMGDTAFLYQTNHRGWPIMEGSIDDMIGKGAQFYVSTTYDDVTNDILKYSATQAVQDERKAYKVEPYPFTTIAKTKDYVIVQLVPTEKLPER